ncbi:hypothetical protein O181_105246 [Austropuccinia psidii MF-1]|uniref:Uncharacterized protein n=1 Tax=Austropuccinia psidii MF-1 TaxID=1389203 RepID=A0A9Q3JNQ5_9BASI|nr:hypothetical protein [Austropuccinia psidii MF-1]
MPKPLAGGYELLITHKELSGSGQDHRAPRKMEPIVFQRKGKKDKELIEEPKSFIYRPEEGVGSDPSFGERRPSGINHLQTSSRSAKYKPKGPQKKQRSPKSNKGKVKCKDNWNIPYPQGYRIPKLEPSAMNSVLNMATTLMGFTTKEQERIERNVPCKE